LPEPQAQGAAVLQPARPLEQRACLRAIPEADPDAGHGDRRSLAVPARAVDPVPLGSEPFVPAQVQHPARVASREWLTAQDRPQPEAARE